VIRYCFTIVDTWALPPHSNIIKNYYLACSMNTLINGEDLLSRMQTAASRSVGLTIILDCCNSSGLFEGLADEQIKPKTQGYELSKTTPSVIMIGSCRKEQNNVTTLYHRKRGDEEISFASSDFVEHFLKATKKAVKKANGDISQNI